MKRPNRKRRKTTRDRERSLYQTLGRLVSLIRNGTGLTQDAAAKIAGVSRTSITNIEAGRQRFPLHTFVFLLEGLLKNRPKRPKRKYKIIRVPLFQI